MYYSSNCSNGLRNGVMEEDVTAGPPEYVIGQDISTFSVEELKRAVERLHEEIARLEHELEAKGSSKAAAEALFRRT